MMKDSTKKMTYNKDFKLKSACKFIPHPLYTVTAILCDSLLYVISTKYDKFLCQSLFDTPSLVANNLSYRNSLHDENSVNTSRDQMPKLNVLLNQEKLIDASWHRTSLCLAVITTRKLYIFSSHIIKKEDFRFSCTATYDSAYNFASLFWLKDQLITEMREQECRTNFFQTTEFRYFIWKCYFTRKKKKIINENLLPLQKLSATALSKEFYTIGINRSPTLRASWCPYETFLSTFHQCERSDFFWCFSSKKNSSKSAWLKPCFLQPDPSSRFLALMVHIHTDNETFQSPNVRLWASYNKNRSFHVKKPFDSKSCTPPFSFQHEKTQSSTSYPTQVHKTSGDFQEPIEKNLFIQISQAEKDILQHFYSSSGAPNKSDVLHKDGVASKYFSNTVSLSYSNSAETFSRYSAMQHAVNVNTSCCVTLLSHEASVISLQWHEPGPLMDGVFIPCYLCVLTENNYITVWLESSFDSPLSFEAVACLPLFVTTPAVYSLSMKEPFMKTSPNSVQMCWLMSHRVDHDTPNIGNLLRLTKKEISSTYTSIHVLNSLFDTNDAYDHINDSFASSQHEEGLPLMSHCHYAHSTPNVSFTSTTLCLIPCASMKSSIDFLFVIPGLDNPLLSTRSPGVFVYIFEGFDSQPQSHVSSRLFLTPAHLPLPCQVFSIISANYEYAGPSFDLSFFESQALCLQGEPILLQNSLYLPCCSLIVLSTTGELWYCFIRPHVGQENCPESTNLSKSNAFFINYTISVYNVQSIFSSEKLMNPVFSSTTLNCDQKENYIRTVSIVPDDSSRVCCVIDEHKYIPCLYLELHSDGIVSVGYTPKDICSKNAYDKEVSSLNNFTVEKDKHPQTVHGCHFFDTLSFSKECSKLFSPHTLTTPKKYFVQSTKQNIFYENTALPKFSYTVWLPLHIYPPIILAVERNSNCLLSFELMIPYAGNSPYFRFIPFTGSFPSSFVPTNYFMQSHPQTPKNFLSSIHQVNVVPLQENRCLLLLLIHLNAHEPNSNTTASSEYHLILFICSTVIKSGSTESLLLESFFNGFLTPLSLLQNTFPERDTNASLSGDSNQLLLTPCVTICDTVIPDKNSLFTCFATYPILDIFSFPYHLTHDRYVGIYQIHESDVSLLAYANLGDSGFATFHTVMAVCLSKDTLVILTAQKRLLFYSLLQFQPFSSIPNTSVDLLLHQKGTSLNGDRIRKKDYYFIKYSQIIDLNNHFLNNVNFLCLKYQDPVLKETHSSLTFQLPCCQKKKSPGNEKHPRVVNTTASNSFYLDTTPHLGRSSLLKIRNLHLTPVLLVSLQLPLTHKKIVTIPFFFKRQVNHLKKIWIPYYQLSPNVKKTKKPAFLPGTIAWNCQYSLSLFIRPTDLNSHSSMNDKPLPLLHLTVQDFRDFQIPVYHPSCFIQYLKNGNSFCRRLFTILKKLYMAVFKWKTAVESFPTHGRMHPFLDLSIDSAWCLNQSECKNKQEPYDDSFSKCTAHTFMKTTTESNTKSLSQQDHIVLLDSHLNSASALEKNHTLSKTIETYDDTLITSAELTTLINNVKPTSNQNLPWLTFGETVELCGVLRFIQPLLDTFYSLHLHDADIVHVFNLIPWSQNSNSSPAAFQHSFDLPLCLYLIAYSLMFVVQLTCDQVLKNYVSDQATLTNEYSNITGTDLAWAAQCNTDHVLFERLLSIRQYWLCHFNTNSYNLLLSWSEVRKSGVGFWLCKPDKLIYLVEENLSKSSYQLDTSLDEASLWYIVSGKISLLRLLLKTQKPINHQMVQFLSQDFQCEKWKTAASKNAYSLLQKRRYHLAVGFFILSQEYREAVDVCCNYLNDPQLSYFLSKLFKVYVKRQGTIFSTENKVISTLCNYIVNKFLLPLAYFKHDRAFESCLLWLSGHYEASFIATAPWCFRPEKIDLDLNGGRHKYRLSDMPQSLSSMNTSNHHFFDENLKFFVELQESTFFICSLRKFMLSQAQLGDVKKNFSFLQKNSNGLRETNYQEDVIMDSEGFAALLAQSEEILAVADTGETLLYLLGNFQPFELLSILKYFSETRFAKTISPFVSTLYLFQCAYFFLSFLSTQLPYSTNQKQFQNVMHILSNVQNFPRSEKLTNPFLLGLWNTFWSDSHINIVSSPFLMEFRHFYNEPSFHHGQDNCPNELVAHTITNTQLNTTFQPCSFCLSWYDAMCEFTSPQVFCMVHCSIQQFRTLQNIANATDSEQLLRQCLNLLNTGFKLLAAIHTKDFQANISLCLIFKQCLLIFSPILLKALTYQFFFFQLLQTLSYLAFLFDILCLSSELCKEQEIENMSAKSNENIECVIIKRLYNILSSLLPYVEIEGTLEHKVNRLIHLQQQLWGNMELATSLGSFLTQHNTVSDKEKMEFPLTNRFLNFETVIQNLLVKTKPLWEIRNNMLRRVLFSSIRYGIWERLIHVFIRQFQTMDFPIKTVNDNSTPFGLSTVLQKSFNALVTVLFSWISQCQRHSIPEALVQTYMQLQIATSVYFPYLNCILLIGESKETSFFCCRLARYLGQWSDDITTLFLKLWQWVNATERLRVLLTLGPIEGFPQAFLCSPLGGFEYPTDRVVFSNAPEPSLAFTMDRTLRIFNFSEFRMLMSTYRTNPIPKLLNFYGESNGVNGLICNSSSLQLCVSTAHNVYEMNLAELLLRETDHTSLEPIMDSNYTFIEDPNLDVFSQWVQKLYHEYVASEIQFKNPCYHNCCITTDSSNNLRQKIMILLYFLFPSLCLANTPSTHQKNYSHMINELVNFKNSDHSYKDTENIRPQKAKKPLRVVPHWENELSKLERMPSSDLEKICSTVPFHYLFLLKGLLNPLKTCTLLKSLKLDSLTETVDKATPQSDTNCQCVKKSISESDNFVSGLMALPFSLQNNFTSSINVTLSQRPSFIQLLTQQHEAFIKHQIDTITSCFFKISKVYKSKNISQATNLQSFSLETSSLSHLHSHPFLPLYIGAITDSHVSYTPVGTPVIVLARFGSLSSEILGVLMLPIKKLIKSVKVTARKSFDQTDNDVSKKSTNQTDASVILTYQKAGAIESLMWNESGTRIISSHANGWVCIWKFPLSPIDQISGSMLDVHEDFSSSVHSTSFCTQVTSNKKLLLSKSPTYFPCVVFKPHTSYCFIARFLYTGDLHNEHLLVTSGLGIKPTLFVGINSNKTSTTISLEPNMGILCIWDMRNNELLKFPQLLQYDASFSINNYATDIAVWHAKQLLIYSDRHGYVRMMNVKQRELNNILYLIHPPIVYSIYKNTCAANSNNDPSSNWQLEKLFLNSDKNSTRSKRIEEYVGKDSASLKTLKKEIVKIFLLTKTQRLVVCYEDSLIRVWDISSLYQKNLFNVFQNTQQTIYNYALYPQDKMKKSIRLFYPSTGCPPLLWETTKLLHIPDLSKHSLISSFMGAVINITPTKTAFRVLLDAYMPSPYHLVTLGTDGTIAMTRL